MRELNASAWFCVTGNGIRLTEDLRRRFLQVRLEPGHENPEGRIFAGNFLEEVKQDRSAILSDYLTIIRWGAQNAADLDTGKTLGSFGDWGRLCRDPFLNLGCLDIVAVMAERDRFDPIREEILELFRTWWKHHGDALVEARNVHEAVMVLACPYSQTRQHLVTRLASLNGTIAGGLKFEALPKISKWSRTNYRLTQIEPFRAGDGPDDGDQPVSDRGPVRRIRRVA